MFLAGGKTHFTLRSKSFLNLHRQFFETENVEEVDNEQFGFLHGLARNIKIGLRIKLRFISCVAIYYTSAGLKKKMNLSSYQILPQSIDL